MLKRRWEHPPSPLLGVLNLVLFLLGVVSECCDPVFPSARFVVGLMPSLVSMAALVSPSS